MIIVVFIIIIAALIALYLFSLRTNNVRRDFSEFKNKYIAHRGLFNNKDIPENSMPAFIKAVESGYGIELDVQLTQNGVPVVFHDDNLNRMCSVDLILHELTYEELSSHKLIETDEIIPLFTDVLNTVNGQVPLIIEIKPSGDSIETLKKVMEILREYKGEYCIESFDPKVIYYLKRSFPKVKRGILSNDFLKNKNSMNLFARFIATNLLYNFLIKPDFIAYNFIYYNQISYKICRKLYSPLNVAWTVRSNDDMKIAKAGFDVIIFDSFTPDK